MKVDKAFLLLPFAMGSLFASEALLNNKGVQSYMNGNFEEARLQLEQAALSCKKGGEYCDQVQYNLGNTHYRLGEEEEDLDKRKELWQQAISDYKKSLELVPSDETAQQNLEYVNKKLQELDDEQQQQENGDEGQQGGAGKEGEQKESSEGKGDESQGDSNENKSEEGDEMGDGTEDDGTTGQQSRSNSESDDKVGQEDGNNDSSGRRLSEEMNQQIDEYMREQANAEKQMGEYLRRNPNSQLPENDGVMSQMFNDPFFQKFFGNDPFFERQFGGLPQNNERDW
jgi:tetratricopeptide (TPR) repeat protein